ncbi:histone H3.3 [Colletotrichum shisoi]|uniref:Histone H3.3 n=1 Tax=Colletotrichum shisoi TaxID=2078593 RepID=A0A5Q4B9F0_9PEZI|nr:histone H3.3 [Colletotrichum shisoi]
MPPELHNSATPPSSPPIPYSTSRRRQQSKVCKTPSRGPVAVLLPQGSPLLETTNPQLPRLPSPPIKATKTAVRTGKGKAPQGRAKKAPKKSNIIVRKTKKRRFRPGTKALREIKKLQKEVKLAIPKRAFSRVVREVAFSISPSLQFQSIALEALQEAAEAFLISVLENANLCAIHARRVTLQKKDVDLVRELTKRMGTWANCSL